MEIELKYNIDNKEKIDRILKDPILQKIRDINSYEEISMRGVYFDTADMNLSGSGAAFRVRREGDRLMATLKWGGAATEGMHRREEINIPICGKQFEDPDISIFDQSEAAPMLREIVAGKKLIPVMHIDFLRRQMRLDTGKAICELSADCGEIRAGGMAAPLMELEIELYSGDEGEIRQLGKEISSRYGLAPLNISKFERGLTLLGRDL